MSLFQDLRNNSSSLVKADILSDATEAQRKVFYFAYHPYMKFYQKFDDIDYDIIGLSDDGEPAMFRILTMLTNREVTGSYARAMVEEYANEHGDLIKLICNKDLAVGVSVKTLVNVFGKGFVPEFEVQLALKEKVKNIRCPILGQIKYNGTRCIAQLVDGKVTFTTRNGFEFSFPALAKLILETKFADDGVWDGELCFGDSKGTNHARISGIVNSAIKGTPMPDNLGIVFNVFDFMSVKEFNDRICYKTYRERFTRLQNSFLPSAGMKIAETFEFSSQDEIQAKFDLLLKEGYEGLILKYWEHLYTFRRTKDWIKLKAEIETTVECLNIIPGEPGTKYEGMIGALQCIGVEDGKDITVDIGSGLSDADRSKPPEDFIGKKIDILYNEVIANKNDNTFSLFLPVFVTVREDLS